MNLDLKNSCKWLRANKICLNASKTELLVFRHPNKNVNYEFKIKMNGKKLYPSKFVKYLGVLIDLHLNFSFHVNSIFTRLSRAIGMLAKIRQCHERYPTYNILWYIFLSSYMWMSNMGTDKK